MNKHERSMTVVVLLADGRRISHEISYDVRPRGAWDNAMARIGADYRAAVDRIRAVVVIAADGDVAHYTGSEPAEVLGLEG